MRAFCSIVAAAAVGLSGAVANAQSDQAPAGAQATCPCPECPCPDCPGAGTDGGGHKAALKESANISVEDNANGAVVRFEAKSKSPEDIAKAREAAQLLAQKLQSGGECPMMKAGKESGAHKAPGGGKSGKKH